MRAYLPVGWDRLALLHRTGELPAPLSGFAVDPQWRAGARDVDEEEWEYEAQALAAESLSDGEGVVLAVDVEPVPDPVLVDGALVLAAPVARRQVAAVLGSDLAWYGVQEIPVLLADHSEA